MPDFLDQIGGASGNPFAPGVPEGFHPPNLKKQFQMPSVPELDDLYQVQRNLLLSMNSSGDEKERHVENAYRTINRWLRTHG